MIGTNADVLHRHSKLAFARSIHFVTTVTSVRGSWFRDDEPCRKLVELFERCRSESELICLGFVLMADHLHALLYQTDDQMRVPACMLAFKKWSAHNHRPCAYPAGPLWRRCYDDVPVPGTVAVRTKLHYLHNNPVRKQLVGVPEEYRWSSASDYAGQRNGIVEVWTEW